MQSAERRIRARRAAFDQYHGQGLLVASHGVGASGFGVVAGMSAVLTISGLIFAIVR